MQRAHGRATAVLATWDVFGRYFAESKAVECYDLWPLPSDWRCPAFLHTCRVLPFRQHQTRLSASAASQFGARIASMYYLLSHSLRLGLHFTTASLFLRTRPDIELLRPIAGWPMAAAVEFYQHPYWRWAVNDMVFLTNRNAASAIAANASLWIGSHVGAAVTAEGLLVRFLENEGLSYR
jgi:hypothetical protein